HPSRPTRSQPPPPLLPSRRSSDLRSVQVADVMRGLLDRVERDLARCAGVERLLVGRSLGLRDHVVVLRIAIAHRIDAEILDETRDRKSTRLNSSHVKIS